ncbi:MAG: sigma-54-dependent Fis family transcriptional regulator [Proteobacteria bacterium]|nr:sigma-54-dependent Fis family transcriptional regulator [Pseudomonadota bacterium]
MLPYRVIVVDDERPNLDSLQRILKSDGAQVTVYQEPAEALLAVRKSSPDILITDLRMGNWSGLELLEAVKLLDPHIEVIVMTAYGTVEVAVEAMKKGAYDFITKPLQRLQVLRAVHRGLEKRTLMSENRELKEQLAEHSLSDGREILGKSEAITRAMETAEQAAKSRATVLIDGESGTGKGLLAEWLHRNGPRSQNIFTKINCATIPDNLLEAELFGYEEGAFTDAKKRKKGRIELADKGTLFLDEIGIAPMAFQANLLRLIQEGEFERLGGVETHKVDLRVVAATNADLKEAITKGQFREDLYYRLNVIHIQMPPLRARREDIAVLVAKFLEESAKKNGRETPLITADAVEALENYTWPGNIRELQNLMERLVVLNKNRTLDLDSLPQEIVASQARKSIVVPIGLPLREVEKALMFETLKSTKGDKKLAARLLGVHPRTLYRFLESDVAPEDEKAQGPSLVAINPEAVATDPNAG